MTFASNLMTFEPPNAPRTGAAPKVTASLNVKGILKAELKRRNLTYADLAARLAEQGLVETEANLRNKISRGAFTAAFFVQCLTAIGCEQIQIRPPEGARQPPA